MTREKLKSQQHIFSKLLLQSGDWKQIFNYQDHISDIIAELVNIMTQSDMFEDYDKKMLFEKIMEQIEKETEKA